MAKATQKTNPEATSLEAYLAAVATPTRRAEAARLAQIYGEVTGFAPVVWGAMLGFGRYEYEYATGRKGTIFAAGFAPRKAEIVLYGVLDDTDHDAIMAEIGPCRLGKGCLYLKGLDGISEIALRRRIRAGLDDLAKRWTVLPG